MKSLIASKCLTSRPRLSNHQPLFGNTVSLIRYLLKWKHTERVTLTPEGFAYLTIAGFITIGSMIRNINLLILMTGIMFAPLLINWRLAVHRLRTLRGRRQLPSQMNANQMVNIQWSCDNSSGSVPAMNVIIKDRIQRAGEESQTLACEPHLTSTPNTYADLRYFGELRDLFFGRNIDRSLALPNIRFQRLLAGQTDTQSYRVLFPQRGRYWIGPTTINCWFPFGLILSRLYIGQECNVMVGPELGTLNPTWEKRLNSTATGNDSVRRSKATQEDTFYALRRWRSGDSRKNIHWRSTAKQRFPMVKQFVERNNRDFALVLDLFADDEQPQTSQDCEKVLSFAATTILSVKTILEGQAAIAICGKETDIYRSKTISGITTKTMPALSVAAGHQLPAIAEGIVSCLDSVSSGTPIYVVSSREMPVSLQLGLHFQTAQNDAESDDEQRQRMGYLTRRMRTGLPMVRWLSVQSEAFKEIFSMNKTPPNRPSSSDNPVPPNQRKVDPRQAMPSDLAEISEKWMDHAQR